MSASEEEGEVSSWGGGHHHHRGSRPPRARAGRSGPWSGGERGGGRGGERSRERGGGRGGERSRGRGGGRGERGGGWGGVRDGGRGGATSFPDVPRGRGGFRGGERGGQAFSHSNRGTSNEDESDTWPRGLVPQRFGRSRPDYRGRGRGFHARTEQSVEHDKEQKGTKFRDGGESVSQGIREQGRGSSHREGFASANPELEVIQRYVYGSGSSTSASPSIQFEDARRGREGDRPGRPPRARRQRFLTEESLEELALEQDPDNVLMALSSSHGGLKDLLQQPRLQPSTLALLLRCLPAVCRSQQPAHVTHVLSLLCDAGFFLTHLMTLASRLLQAGASGSLDRDCRDVLAGLAVVPDLVNEVTRRLPSSSEKCKPALVLLRQAVQTCDHRGEHAELLEALERSEMRCSEEIQQQQQQNPGGRRGRGMAGRDDLPPEDFRLLPVFPSHQDLQLDQQPFLRANVTQGKYRDAEQYLDIQFRLLREDYIAPLRESIGAYRKQLEEEGRPPRHVKGIRMYRGVHVIDTRCEETVEHVLQFDVSGMSRVRWDASKRLITGSLVCLTNDHFNTLVFATVTGRKIEDLQQGNINVQFELLDLDASRFTAERPALMVESSAFFEAYRPVLECLKAFRTPLPFERYIVHVHPYVDPPAYLTDETVYNLRTLLNSKERLSTRAKRTVVPYKVPRVEIRPESDCDDFGSLLAVEAEEDEEAHLQLVGESSPFSTDATETIPNTEKLLDGEEDLYAARRVPVLQLQRWPAVSRLCLNQSQLEAVQTALTKELAIIQGPPGTGKTYVGLQVVKVLLRNSHKFQPEVSVVEGKAKKSDEHQDQDAVEDDSGNHEDSSSPSAETFDKEPASSKETSHASPPRPILIVCYTNHALDQFLEGILQFCPDGIVRVGGRSKNDNLAKFNLKMLQQSKDLRGKVREVVRLRFFECREEMRKTQTIMEGKKAQIAVSTTGIVNQKFLEMGMTRDQVSTLQRGPLGQSLDGENPLLVWLGFGRDGMSSTQEERLRFHKTLCGVLEKSILLGDSQWIFTNKNIITYCKALGDYRNELYEYIGYLEEELEHVWGKQRMQTFQELTEMRRLVQKSYQELLPMEEIRLFLESYTRYAMDGMSVKEWLGIYEDPTLCADMLLRLHTLVRKEGEQQDAAAAAGKGETSEELGEAELLCQQRALDDRDALLTGGDVSKAALEWARAELLLTPQVFQLPRIPLPGGQVVNAKVEELGRRLAGVLQGREQAGEEEATRVEDVWDVPQSRRPALYRLFLRKAVKNMTESLREALDHYRHLASRRGELSMENTVDILKTAKVIGMTTTGAAKHSAAIHKVRPRVVVVEEAAEVLESHLLATLHPGCQQLLLIGDHQQLRPSPAVYKLARQFRLDVSLFERMVTNKVHHKVLSVQHRMRPEISALVKPLYPHLADHASVLSREHIRGMGRDVFFLQHEHEEEQVADTHTRANHHEAQMVMALCGYLLQQGYSPDKITILATYMGQVSLIRDMMKTDPTISQMTKPEISRDPFQQRDSSKSWERVNVTPVDNFQGEENDIILLSLVRSNEEGSVGFLSIDNRVCVALSRARLGLFLVGNLRLLAQKSDLWKTVQDILEEAGQLGSSLPLRCHCHPDQTNHVTTPEEFGKVAPNGGCTLPCGHPLPCGHLCEETCHPGKDSEYHESKTCKLPCKTVCTNGHPCRKQCCEPCGDCRVPVQKTMTRCGHRQSMLCYEEKYWRCREPCPKTLDCGHKCKGTCDGCQFQCSIHCKETVQKQLPCGHEQAAECHINPQYIKCVTQVTTTRSKCGHDITVLCHQRRLADSMKCKVVTEKTIPDCGHKIMFGCSENPTRLQCKEICNKTMPCSHTCQHECSKCCRGIFSSAGHLPCSQKVKVTLGCGHDVETECRKKSEAACKSRCGAKLDCGHECEMECAECTTRGSHAVCVTVVSCTLSCRHQTSRVKCCELKSYVCSETCGAPLPCGHACRATCNKCLQGRLHQPCSALCHKLLPCGHECKKRCGVACLPCQARCNVRCPHLKCQLVCGEPCKPCPKPCLRRCPHVECPLTCADVCPVPPCNRPCSRRRLKKCKHACAAACGEPCFCRECNTDMIRSAAILSHLQKHKEIQLDTKGRGQNQPSSPSDPSTSAGTQPVHESHLLEADGKKNEGGETTPQKHSNKENPSESGMEKITSAHGIDSSSHADSETKAQHQMDTVDNPVAATSTSANDHDVSDKSDQARATPGEEPTPAEGTQTESARQGKTETPSEASAEASKQKAGDREKLKKTLYRLHDCGHIFPINDLDDYMAACVEPGCLPTCPECQAPVHFNVRYGDLLIKPVLAQRAEAKKEIKVEPQEIVDSQDIQALIMSISLRQQDFMKLNELTKRVLKTTSPRLAKCFRRRLHLLRALVSRKGLLRWVTKYVVGVDEALLKQITAYKDALLESEEDVSAAEEDEQLELDRLSLFARLAFLKEQVDKVRKHGDKDEKDQEKDYISTQSSLFQRLLHGVPICKKPALKKEDVDECISSDGQSAGSTSEGRAEARQSQTGGDSSGRDTWGVEDERLSQRLASVYAALAAGDVVREQFGEMSKTYSALVASLTSQPSMADVLARLRTFPDLRTIATGEGWNADAGGDFGKDSSESSEDEDEKGKDRTRAGKETTKMAGHPREVILDSPEDGASPATTGAMLFRLQTQRGGRGRARGKGRRGRQESSPQHQEQSQQNQNQDQQHQYRQHQYQVYQQQMQQYQDQQWRQPRGLQEQQLQQQYHPSRQHQFNLMDYVVKPPQSAKYGQLGVDFSAQPGWGRGGKKQQRRMRARRY